MSDYVLGLQQLDQTQTALAGGKGARLGELSRIEGIRVPDGFCVTTDAFQRIMAATPSLDAQLDRLSRMAIVRITDFPSSSALESSVMAL